MADKPRTLAMVICRGRIQSLRGDAGGDAIRKAFPNDPEFGILAEAEDAALEAFLHALERLTARAQELHPDHPGKEKAGNNG